MRGLKAVSAVEVVIRPRPGWRPGWRSRWCSGPLTRSRSAPRSASLSGPHPESGGASRGVARETWRPREPAEIGRFRRRRWPSARQHVPASTCPFVPAGLHLPAGTCPLAPAHRRLPFCPSASGRRSCHPFQMLRTERLGAKRRPEVRIPDAGWRFAGERPQRSRRRHGCDDAETGGKQTPASGCPRRGPRAGAPISGYRFGSPTSGYPFGSARHGSSVTGVSEAPAPMPAMIDPADFLGASGGSGFSRERTGGDCQGRTGVGATRRSGSDGDRNDGIPGSRRRRAARGFGGSARGRRASGPFPRARHVARAKIRAVAATGGTLGTGARSAARHLSSVPSRLPARRMGSRYARRPGRGAMGSGPWSSTPRRPAGARPASLSGCKRSGRVRAALQRLCDGDLRPATCEESQECPIFSVSTP